MNDLISRQDVLDWINRQVELVTKKQVAGTDQSILTREDLVAMQRCLSTFEKAVNKIPIAYSVEKVVAELEEEKADLGEKTGYAKGITKAIDIVRNGGKE